jgi:hypothetical protein
MIPQIKRLCVVRIARPGVHPQAEDVAFFAVERKIWRDTRCMFTREKAHRCATSFGLIHHDFQAYFGAHCK